MYALSSTCVGSPFQHKFFWSIINKTQNRIPTHGNDGGHEIVSTNLWIAEVYYPCDFLQI